MDYHGTMEDLGQMTIFELLDELEYLDFLEQKNNQSLSI